MCNIMASDHLTEIKAVFRGGIYERKIFTAAYRDDDKHNGAFCAWNYGECGNGG